MKGKRRFSLINSLILLFFSFLVWMLWSIVSSFNCLSCLHLEFRLALWVCIFLSTWMSPYDKTWLLRSRFFFLFVFYQLGLLRKCLKDACFCPVDRAGPAIGTAGQRRAGVIEGVSDACRSAWGRARGRNLQVHIRECTCWQKTFLISLLLSKIIDYLLNT